MTANLLLLRTGHQHRAKGTLVMARRTPKRWASNEMIGE